MDILFFLTTLVTGFFLGAIAVAGACAVIIRNEDGKRKAQPKPPEGDLGRPGVIKNPILHD